jgi:hypothetical protein
MGRLASMCIALGSIAVTAIKEPAVNQAQDSRSERTDEHNRHKSIPLAQGKPRGEPIFIDEEREQIGNFSDSIQQPPASDSSEDSSSQIPIRSLFPQEAQFPQPHLLTPRQLRSKLRQIYSTLDRNRIAIGLVAHLPDEIIYRYLTEEIIPHGVTHSHSEPAPRLVIDGCDGRCSNCFQQKYCSAKDSQIFKL